MSRIFLRIRFSPRGFSCFPYVDYIGCPSLFLFPATGSGCLRCGHVYPFCLRVYRVSALELASAWNMAWYAVLTARLTVCGW